MTYDLLVVCAYILTDRQKRANERDVMFRNILDWHRIQTSSSHFFHLSLFSGCTMWLLWKMMYITYYMSNTTDSCLETENKLWEFLWRKNVPSSSRLTSERFCTDFSFYFPILKTSLSFLSFLLSSKSSEWLYYGF